MSECVGIWLLALSSVAYLIVGEGRARCGEDGMNNIAMYSGKTQSRPRLTDSVVSSKALHEMLCQTRFVDVYSKNIKWTGPEIFLIKVRICS